MPTRTGLVFSVLAAHIALAATQACGDSDSASCVDGQQIACDCSGGGSGVQVCSGGAYGSCSCDTDGEGGDVILPDVIIDGSGDDGGEGPGDTDGEDAVEDADGSGGEDTLEDATTPDNPTPGCYRTPDIDPVAGAGLELPPYPGGLLPGEPCVSHEDCLYGLCSTTSIINQGKFPVCIKKCGGCGDKSPACSWDDDLEGVVAFTCVKGKDMEGESVSHCARRCDGGVEPNGLPACKALDPNYSTCNSNSAGLNYCGGW